MTARHRKKIDTTAILTRRMYSAFANKHKWIAEDWDLAVKGTDTDLRPFALSLITQAATWIMDKPARAQQTAMVLQ